MYLDENRIQELPRGFFRLSNLEKGTLTGLDILFKPLFNIFLIGRFWSQINVQINDLSSAKCFVSFFVDQRSHYQTLENGLLYNNVLRTNLKVLTQSRTLYMA